MPEYLPIVGLFFTIVAAVVGAIFVSKSTINKETVREQKELVEAQANRLDFQDKRIEALERENELLRERVNALEETKHELYEQVKSLPAFATMAAEMVVMSKRMEEVLGSISRLADRMGHNG